MKSNQRKTSRERVRTGSVLHISRLTEAFASFMFFVWPENSAWNIDERFLHDATLGCHCVFDPGCSCAVVRRPSPSNGWLPVLAWEAGNTPPTAFTVNQAYEAPMWRTDPYHTLII